jgi:hypothetical protein
MKLKSNQAKKMPKSCGRNFLKNLDGRPYVFYF